MEWRTIKDFEGLYEISDNGILYSLITNTILKSSIGNHGYNVVSLHKDKKQKTKTVHRLLAKTFIPNPNNLPMVNHKDGVKTNNYVDNLEWCTSEYNNAHAVETGLRTHAKGERVHTNKLTEKQVLEIRAKYKPRVYTQKQLGIEYNVTRTCIQAIIENITWKHLK